MMEQKVEIRYLKGFVLYTLCALVAGFLLGVVQGAILGMILGIAGFDVQTIQIVCGITGFIFGTVVSFFIFRWIIQTQILPQVARQYEPRLP